jgi:hypothetical protein
VKVNLICPNNGWGLSRDAEILFRGLTEHGAEVAWYRPTDTGRKGDCNLFVEVVDARFFELAERQVLIPNAEWTKNWWRHAGRLHLWCKTVDAHVRLSLPRVGAQSCHHLGFTSVDHMDTTVKRAREFLHLAGRSNQRQSQLVIDTWAKHPKWPFLTVVRDPERPLRLPSTRAPNLSVVHKKLGEETVRELQNRCRFHLCTSSYEGFGHYMNEALSCGAIPLVPGDAPMNEIVPVQAGLYIKVARVSHHQHVMLAHIDQVGLEECVERALDLSAGAVEALSAQARDVYLDRDKRFHERLGELVGGLV